MNRERGEGSFWKSREVSGFRVRRTVVADGGERWSEVFGGRDSREKRELLSLEKNRAGLLEGEETKKNKKKAEKGFK